MWYENVRHSHKELFIIKSQPGLDLLKENHNLLRVIKLLLKNHSDVIYKLEYVRDTMFDTDEIMDKFYITTSTQEIASLIKTTLVTCFRSCEEISIK